MTSMDRRKRAKERKAQEKAARRARAEARLADYEPRPIPADDSFIEARSTMAAAGPASHVTAKEIIERLSVVADEVSRAEEELTRQQAEGVRRAKEELARQRTEEARALTVALRLLDHDERVVQRELDQCLLTWIVLSAEGSGRLSVLADLYLKISAARGAAVPSIRANSIDTINEHRYVYRQHHNMASALSRQLARFASSSRAPVTMRSRRSRFAELEHELSSQDQAEWPSPWLEATGFETMRGLRRRIVEESLRRPFPAQPTPHTSTHRDPEACQHDAARGHCMYVTCSNHPLGAFAMDAD
jgi:hypothetical protein